MRWAAKMAIICLIWAKYVMNSNFFLPFFFFFLWKKPNNTSRTLRIKIQCTSSQSVSQWPQHYYVYIVLSCSFAPVYVFNVRSTTHIHVFCAVYLRVRVSAYTLDLFLPLFTFSAFYSSVHPILIVYSHAKLEWKMWAKCEIKLCGTPSELNILRLNCGWTLDIIEWMQNMRYSSRMIVRESWMFEPIHGMQ